MGSTETKVSEWVDVTGSGAWSGSGIAAYRIWQEFDGRRWFQRHEWKRVDGTLRLDTWIEGASGWCPSASTVVLHNADEVA